MNDISEGLAETARMARGPTSEPELETLWDALEEMYNAAELWNQFAHGKLWVAYDPASQQLAWQVRG